MNYDVSAFSGHWPFRRLRNRGVPAPGWGGVVSSLDAIFYNDPREGDLPLLEALPEGWQLAMCLNPRLPWMEQALREFSARGVRFGRLYPGIHGYDLENGAVHSLCAAASEVGMTLFLTARMEDNRLCWLLRQYPVPTEACLALARKYPKATFVLSHFYCSELTDCLPLPENVWTDTAGLCHGLTPVEDLIHAGFPAEKLLFGSFSPLECRESHLLNLPGAYESLILSENGRRLMEVLP